MAGIIAARYSHVESNPAYIAAVARQKAKQQAISPSKPEVVEATTGEDTAVEGIAEIEDKILLNRSEIKQIIHDVARKHNLTYDDLVWWSKKYHIVAARDEAIKAVSIARPKLSLNGIGRHFGNRCHTTILHSLTKKRK